MKQTARVENKILIPKVPKKQILRRYKRIKMVERCSGRLYYVKNNKPLEINPWKLELAGKATGLKRFCDVTTYHRYLYRIVPETRIAVILAQIPRNNFGRVVAFEIVNLPWASVWTQRGCNESNAARLGYHVVTVRCYIRK